MHWAESDRARRRVLRAACGALLLMGFIETGHAQTIPPLDVPDGGVVPGLESSGCEGGPRGFSPYSTSTSLTSAAIPQTGYANGATPTNGANTNTIANAPIYGEPNAGANVPLYANPLAGDNVPLYSP